MLSNKTITATIDIAQPRTDYHTPSENRTVQKRSSLTGQSNLVPRLLTPLEPGNEAEVKLIETNDKEKYR